MGNKLQPWKVLAIRTENVLEASKQAYLQGLMLSIKLKNGIVESFEIPLMEALQHPFNYADGVISTALDFPDDSSQEDAKLELLWAHQNGMEQELLTIPLQGANALLLQSDSQILNSRFTADLSRSNPTLSLIEDQEENTSLFAFDCYGRMHNENFNPSNLKSLISYDQGFGGYTVQAIIPIPSFPTGRQDKEQADLFELSGQLKQALSSNPPLSPPLQFLKQACESANADFIEAFVHFLSEWKGTPGLQCSSAKALEPMIKSLDWKTVSHKDRQAILWTNRLLEQIEEGLKNGDTLQDILEKNHWPFASEFKKQEPDFKDQSPLNVLALQIFNLIPYLPPLEFPSNLKKEEEASLLSSYFRIYGIDHELLSPKRNGTKEQFDHLEAYWKAQGETETLKMEQAIVLEAPLTNRIIPEDLPQKMEEHRPGIVLEVQQGKVKQTVALAYDPSGTGMKWPILNGRFLIRFQPNFKELPYRIRLRQARQIPYPQSAQIYSYESDILITEKGQPPTEQTLSMNRVYETWDGYRFYLSGVGTSADSNLKRIQLAVNHDPAKYFLTYPGAILVFLGIVLLFWIIPYKKQKNK